MGFVPIFITLGAFVGMFSLLVSHNMGLRRKRYMAAVEELQNQLQVSSPKISSEGDGLRVLEGEFQRQRAAKKVSELEIAKIERLFQEAKLGRHAYRTLIRTKPYAFVAKLFGHRPI
ncbi:hypothetical protein ADIS_3200 [Lunatimonas lonarensis]|uniref:Uncharacterized protein n=1 Tax=Lunatimonas lonarensis TaxID=1232681 RepID=R7ZPQ5_9BACT|nr:hypothetical protein [Lunatimonas lonarensis]EON76072.1 hypothetical protein ADIS_3200 [Lunatimonas lonarensis]